MRTPPVKPLLHNHVPPCICLYLSVGCLNVSENPILRALGALHSPALSERSFFRLLSSPPQSHPGDSTALNLEQTLVRYKPGKRR